MINSQKTWLSLSNLPTPHLSITPSIFLPFSASFVIMIHINCWLFTVFPNLYLSPFWVSHPIKIHNNNLYAIILQIYISRPDLWLQMPSALNLLLSPLHIFTLELLRNSQCLLNTPLCSQLSHFVHISPCLKCPSSFLPLSCKSQLKCFPHLF